MTLKLFYRTQRDLAIGLNKLIDSYWQNKILENELIEGIKNLYENNQEKLIKNNQFTKVVQQQCGKRRLAVVEKILEIRQENSPV
ncbi:MULTISPECIES: TIGR04540 family protein [Bacillus]|uniref:TIGR04540 family protein n=1 Tax=Bacillus TaxID=1386 RepID=UPI00224353DA|nr:MULTISPECIES: TIGR04540 family protein [Bacillus]MCY9373382.1 TIGR04540 family protein [Bacillus haynesii]MDN5388439.1 TIGR04540 family protein [Bacillus sp. LB7]MEC0721630.1 TIGR04540 family protein [Bacillus haynesii]MEC1023199.1 TIGR04540 family protein [Bacillus paralicheniformis]MEC1025765.1 TIGR04540 family protein [Bacillus paralicheniformis]